LRSCLVSPFLSNDVFSSATYERLSCLVNYTLGAYLISAQER
jgi:hypothetical protein